MSTTIKTIHIGRNISRIRELRQMKQEALATAIGVSQQTISSIENCEIVEDEKLQQIATALGVTSEAIKNFSEEAVITYFNNNFYDNASGHGFGNYNMFTFNPLDKLIESQDQNKQLYERLLKAEQEKIVYLEKLLNKVEN